MRRIRLIVDRTRTQSRYARNAYHLRPFFAHISIPFTREQHAYTRTHPQERTHTQHTNTYAHTQTHPHNTHIHTYTHMRTIRRNTYTRTHVAIRRYYRNLELNFIIYNI